MSKAYLAQTRDAQGTSAEMRENMEEEIRIRKEQAEPVYDSRFIRVFDLQYAPGKHYYDVSRRNAENLVAVKTAEEFRKMLPDAVSCVVILQEEGQEPKLLLSREYRFPAGRFLLSVPAGLLDEEDKKTQTPVFSAARREIQEETGILLTEEDSIQMINPLVFSTPGMTDESNGLVQIVIRRNVTGQLSQTGAVGGECFDGFRLVGKEEAEALLRQGVDENGFFYSVYTWMALICFVTGFWMQEG